MKKVICLLSFLPSLGFGQSIKKDEFDKFLKKRTIETSSSMIYANYLIGEDMTISFRAVDSSYYVYVGGAGKAVGVVGKNDYFIFLLDNDSVVKILPTGIQDYKVNSAVIGTSVVNSKTYSHCYAIDLADLDQLKLHRIKKVRVYYNDVYDELDIKGKRSIDFQKLVELFCITLSRKP